MLEGKGRERRLWCRRGVDDDDDEGEELRGG